MSSPSIGDLFFYATTLRPYALGDPFTSIRLHRVVEIDGSDCWLESLATGQRVKVDAMRGVGYGGYVMDAVRPPQVQWIDLGTNASAWREHLPYLAMLKGRWMNTHDDSRSIIATLSHGEGDVVLDIETYTFDPLTARSSQVRLGDLSDMQIAITPNDPVDAWRDLEDKLTRAA